MSKDDVADIPAEVPRKRRALESAPDLWVRVWYERSDPHTSQHRRLGDELERRRNARRDRIVGLIVGSEGVTPQQLESVRQLLVSSGATRIVHPGVSSKLHTACRSVGVPVDVRSDVRDDYAAIQEVVKSADYVIAAPKEPHPTSAGLRNIWDGARYAKHRRTPVRVVLPNGNEHEETS